MVCGAIVSAQDRLRTMPGYAPYQRMVNEIPTAVKSGALSATWTDDSKAVEHTRDARRYRFDVSSRRLADADGDRRRARTGGAERSGRTSWAGRRNAGSWPSIHHHDLAGRVAEGDLPRPQHLSEPRGRLERTRHHDRRSAASRVKYGTASWVYGEELEQITAMWWSPDGRKLAYYRFDEKDGPGFLSDDEPDAAADDARRRSATRRPASAIRSSISTSTTSRRTRRRRSTSATASRSTTPASATTSIACGGRRTAANCSSSAPTGGRT